MAGRSLFRADNMARQHPRKIEIRRAEVGDAEALARIYADPAVQAQTLQLPYPSVEVWRKRLAANDENQYALVADVGGEIVGNLGLTRIARARRAHVGEIGMGVREAWHGQGVGRALLKAALDLADRWLALRRIELTVYTDNERAIRLYRHFGFEVEGTHRAYSVRDGVYVDAFSMARIVSGPEIGKRKRAK